MATLEGRLARVAVAVAMLLAIVAVAGLGADDAVGDEAGPAGLATAVLPTAEQTKGALESVSTSVSGEPMETEPKAAEELPHRELGREEALELAEGVFGAQLEEPAGIYRELEPEKFLSSYAAVVPASTLPETEEAGKGPAYEVESEAGGPRAGTPTGPVLIESTLPLRTENAEGEQEAVNLSLQSPEGSGGELQPQNPLTELSIPAHLGEGVSLAGGIQIELTHTGGDGTPASFEEDAPTDVEEKYAFYPNVAENTDLIVAPTSTGVDMMTDIRSAEAPDATTYELSLPSGADLVSGPGGSVEVAQGDKSLALIPPPSATDAAGEPVPATQRIEDGRLTVQVSPDTSTSFPILVDPEIVSEVWDWTTAHSSQAAWTPSSNDPGLATFPYAAWEPAAQGLDLSSAGWGNGIAGGQAQWLYTVPRYNQDYEHYGTTPTTWIYQLWTENVWFRTYGNSGNYPAMVLGLADPGSAGWWTTDTVQYGGMGDQSSANFGFTNPSDTATKAADFDYVTYENEYPAKHRDAYIGHAAVAVVDEGAPRVLGLHAPTGWLTGASPQAIGYEFEDTGLGVRSAGIRLPGETSFHAGWGADFNCLGTAISPCPRKVTSSEAGRPGLDFIPAELPTGEDTLEVMVGDPLWTLLHVAAQNVRVKIDNKAPEVTLSGALTEQEKLGTLKSEYPLAIKATDGTAADPQSGVAKVEVKVDGKTKQTWSPGCAAGNCSFSGTWTLKTSEYTAASHEVEVLVTDAAGVVSENTIEVDLGEAPPQTSFTSSHPSHETTGISAISFKATKGGAPVEGATFKCSLDGAAASPCTSPYNKLPEHFETGPHIFTVAAVKSGKADPTPATWRFETDPYPAAPQPSEKLVFPETGKQTASYYTLEAEWGANPEGKAAEGVTGVTFQVQLPGSKTNEKGETVFDKYGKPVPNTFETVPAGCTIDGQGRPVSWPLPAHTHPGHSAPVYLRVRGCPLFEDAKYPEKGIQFRAVYDGGARVTGTSAPATTEFVSDANANRVATDATETVGPATVDLLTGAYTVSHTDVSIPVPGYEANLEFTRTYSSTIDRSLPGYSMVLGGAWQPGTPLESESEGQAWSRIVKQVIEYHPAKYGDECWAENEEGEEEGTFPCPAERCTIETCEEWLEEDAQQHEEWIELLDSEGSAVIFEISGENYVAPEYAKELKLTRLEGNLVLAYPNGTRNIFISNGAKEWTPKYVSFQSSPSSMRLVYEEPNFPGQLRLAREIAPTPEAIKCEAFESEATVGCRTLVFEYQTFSIPGHYFGALEKLVGITYYGPSGNKAAKAEVARYEYNLENTSEDPCYGGTCYEKEEMLVDEYDPRLPNLGETYTYDKTSGFGNLLAAMHPPGEEPWDFEYEYGNLKLENFHWNKPSRLKAVTRAGAKTTLAYGVPVQGAGAPYDMSAESITRWGQSDLPVDATAVFPPNHVPAEYPPHEYPGATIHYIDPEGYEVNTASPSPPGVSGTTIATTETDIHGNVVRELDPQNRLIALAAPEPVTRSHELDSHSVYNANGTELLESWGPLHQVRPSSGEPVEARRHTTTHYDEGEPTPPAGTPPAYLPTKETVGAVVAGKEGEIEAKTTETHYEWSHRLPTETIVDPGALAIRSVTEYNAAGQVIETRQPKGAGGGTAGDTRTVYYSAGANPEGAECANSPRYANLPCVVMPAKETTKEAGRPELPGRQYLGYDDLDEPTEVLEDSGSPESVRATYITYDEAGRQVESKTVGGGTAITRSGIVKTEYSPTLGFATKQQFVCEKECTGFDSQATTAEYNKLGQVTGYEDADGNKTETKYDAYGRPVSVTDAKGTSHPWTQTLHYDEASGVVTSLEVSGVGTFTATYDADGDLVERGLPNGLSAKTTYNPVGEPMKLAYTKTSSCGESCTWYEETLDRSIEGQIVADNGTLVNNHYTYDKNGRLIEAQETPTEGKSPAEVQCTSRAYTYDADSNRLTKTTRTGVGGACATSVVATQPYRYDEADRLEGPTYDAWGRITKLPAEFAGGKELVTSYFSNNMVATQSQNGVTNTFQLDATGRQRQREQAGGVAGMEVFHYDGPGDSPSWTSLGSTWSRNISGIGGEIAAVQESTGTTTFKLTDLHGDVVASASSSPVATKLLATYRSDEFGEPVSGSAGRFGWLGGKSRRTELSSGLIQMGARSYIPQLGRFLTPDPVRGGSANAYDYANQDPVNEFDIGGEKPRHFSKIAGVVKAGVRIRSPRNNNGRDSYGKLKARFYVRVNCGGCEGTSHLSVYHVKYEIEKVGSHEVLQHEAIHGPNLNKGPGEQPFTANNWSRNTAPIESGCINGDEYQITLTVIIGIGAGRIEPYSVSAQAICGEG